MEPEEGRNTRAVSRRTLIASAALVPAWVPVAALTARAQPAVAPATVLSSAERKTLEAFVDRLVPKDEFGPGAVECGAANYIDVQLAGALAAEKTNFVAGLAAIDAFARKSQDAGFAELGPEKRDALITAMEGGSAEGFANSRAVFARIRRLTLEGMFSDPHYGGNTNFAGWDLIRYPGPRLAVGPEEQSMTGSIKPYRRSAWPESPNAGGGATGGSNGRH
jgi:gluconate 2-dehydrogenase gamma chain